MDDYKTIVAEWHGDLTFIAENEAGGRVQMGMLDGKPGISPMELLLAGLAGCTGVDVAHILRKKRQALDNLRVKIHAKRADEHPKVYIEIEIEYLLWGQDLSDKAVQQAIRLSENKYCSASAMLGKSAKITSKYRIFALDEMIKA